jgi:leader peptidase (prepilin peptidase)/N-methyltransferase
MLCVDKMTSDILLTFASVCTVMAAVFFGPMILTVRACLRLVMTITSVRRWQTPVAMGLCAGMIAATVASGFFIGGPGAVFTATLCLLILMAVLDIAWRWLPFAWTLPLLALGMATAILQDTVSSAFFGVIFGGGILLTLQFSFWMWRGVIALGTGDVWLAAGLGSFAGMPQISWILCLAALTALAFEGVAIFRSQRIVRQRFGVAYGTHLCLAYLVFLFF